MKVASDAETLRRAIHLALETIGRPVPGQKMPTIETMQRAVDRLSAAMQITSASDPEAAYCRAVIQRTLGMLGSPGVAGARMPREWASGELIRDMETAFNFRAAA